MPNLPHLSGKEIIRAFERLGFIVPMHGEVAIGTLHSILKQAKVSPDEFIKIAK